MTWLTATGRLAAQLRALITTPQELAPGEHGLPAAATLAVFELVQRVHGELRAAVGDRRVDGPEDGQTWRQRYDRLAASPVPAALRRLAERGDGAPQTPSGLTWRRVARDAAIAAAEWEASTPDSRPAGTEADAALADLASLMWASSTAFANSTKAIGAYTEPDDVPVLAAATADVHATARTARHAVRGIAHGRSTLSYADLREHQPQSPVPLAGPADLSTAMKRLAHLVASAGTMGPRIVAQVASLHRICTTHLGDAIAGVGFARQHDGLTRLGAALRQHAQALTIRAPHVESLRTLDPIDDIQIAALRQATAIARVAEESAEYPSESVRDLLVAVPLVSEVTISVAARARSEIIGGKWLRPVSVAASPPDARRSAPARDVRDFVRQWQPTTAFDDVPLATALHHAARDAERLHVNLPRHAPRPARVILADVVDRSRGPGVVNRPGSGTSR